MSKGFILVDKIPCNCYECGNHNYHFCSWTGDCIEGYMDDNGRPESCPIQTLPEYSRTGKSDYYQWGDWEDGWNACLDGLLDE